MQVESDAERAKYTENAPENGQETTAGERASTK